MGTWSQFINNNNNNNNNDYRTGSNVDNDYCKLFTLYKCIIIIIIVIM